MSRFEALSVESLPTLLRTVARCRNIQGDVPRALELLLPYEGLADEATLPNIRFWEALGNSYRELGDASKATVAYEKGFSQAMQLCKVVKAAEMRCSQAQAVLSLEQDPAKASTLAEQIEQLLRGHEAKEARVNLTALRGNIHLAQGNYTKAQQLITVALHDTRPLGMRNRFVTLCGDLANLYIQTGNLPEAIALLETVLETHCPEYKYTIPLFLVRLSQAYILNNDPHKAVARAQEALEIGIRFAWNMVVEQASYALQIASATDSRPHLLMIPAPRVVYSR